MSAAFLKSLRCDSALFPYVLGQGDDPAHVFGTNTVDVPWATVLPSRADIDDPPEISCVCFLATAGLPFASRQ
jgi:hypothetical protein